MVLGAEFVSAPPALRAPLYEISALSSHVTANRFAQAFANSMEESLGQTAARMISIWAMQNSSMPSRQLLDRHYHIASYSVNDLG